MQNIELARLFREIADLLELKAENPFKIRAYRRAAATVEALAEELDRAAADGRLRQTAGIGAALAAKAEEWLATGQIAYHEALRREIPSGLLEVMAIPGVGPKRAWLMYQELGVRDLSDLAAACRAHRVQRLKGMGEKSEAAILAGIDQVKERTSAWPLGVALPLAEGIAAALRALPGVEAVLIAGSVRRMKESVHDLDFVAAAPEGAAEALMEAYGSLPVVGSVLSRGATKCTVLLRNGLQADLRVLAPAAFGSALHHFTGSKEHNVSLRELAQRRGLSISEYGLLSEATGEREPCATEAALFERLGLAFIPPELREDGSEISRAQAGPLPELISLPAIRGDLHMHTTWSDGAASIETMARAAAARGYAYLAICDHSPQLAIVRGLDAERLRQQAAEIAAVNEEGLGAHILTGVEVDIRADGSLDLPDEVLATRDVVVASLHVGLRQDRAQVMKRLRTACENPHVDVIGHPTGRLLGSREPADVDMEALVEWAVKTQTALEINASPHRLDLRDTHARLAQEAGAVLAIDTDAHAPEELADMRYGVGVARRAWVGPAAVLNSWPLDTLQRWLRERR